MLLAIGAQSLTLLAYRLWGLVSGAILLDLAVNTNLVAGQQAIYALSPNQRSRINTIYIAMFMSGVALNSAVAGVAYMHGAWKTW